MQGKKCDSGIRSCGPSPAQGATACCVLLPISISMADLAAPILRGERHNPGKIAPLISRRILSNHHQRIPNDSPFFLFLFFSSFFCLLRIRVRVRVLEIENQESRLECFGPCILDSACCFRTENKHASRSDHRQTHSAALREETNGQRVGQFYLCLRQASERSNRSKFARCDWRSEVENR